MRPAAAKPTGSMRSGQLSLLAARAKLDAFTKVKAEIVQRKPAAKARRGKPKAEGDPDLEEEPPAAKKRRGPEKTGAKIKAEDGQELEEETPAAKKRRGPEEQRATIEASGDPIVQTKPAANIKQPKAEAEGAEPNAEAGQSTAHRDRLRLPPPPASLLDHLSSK